MSIMIMKKNVEINGSFERWMEVIYYHWIFKDKLALSPMPSGYNIKFLSEIFDNVVVLVEESELVYDLNLWRKFNVNLLYIPIPDFSPPHLLTVYEVAKWIDNAIRNGKRVLVHCYGGLGRSGTIAASYLIYANGLKWQEAINHVRSCRPGAIEVLGQQAVLEAFDLMLRTSTKPAIDMLIELGSKFNFGRGVGHASKVTQLSLKLWHLLRNLLKLENDTVLPLIIAGILHDIGVKIDERNHHVLSYNLFLENARELSIHIDGEILEIAGFLIFHHRRKTGCPNKDESIPLDIRLVVSKLTGILRVADGLDRSLSQIVDDLDYKLYDDQLVIEVFCRDICDENIQGALRKSELLSKMLGKQIIMITREFY